MAAPGQLTETRGRRLPVLPLCISPVPTVYGSVPDNGIGFNDKAGLVVLGQAFMNKEITIELYQNESDDEDEDGGEWRPDDDYGDGK